MGSGQSQASSGENDWLLIKAKSCIASQCFEHVTNWTDCHIHHVGVNFLLCAQIYQTCHPNATLLFVTALTVQRCCNYHSQLIRGSLVFEAKGKLLILIQLLRLPHGATTPRRLIKPKVYLILFYNPMWWDMCLGRTYSASSQRWFYILSELIK